MLSKHTCDSINIDYISEIVCDNNNNVAGFSSKFVRSGLSASTKCLWIPKALPVGCSERQRQVKIFFHFKCALINMNKC